ncbi:thiamine phosphate synthase [Fulvivirga sp. M361]|nr:thiamine phosphate synthase [Fulvivirga sp. M361]
MSKDDIRLCLVTDETMYKDEDHLAHIVSSAVAGGVTMVQLREKTADTKSKIRKGLLLKKVLYTSSVPLIINDDVEVALTVDAEGVHLGQSDMPVNEARKLLGKDKIIGISVESKAHAIEANSLPVDYVGLSPVFQTGTKKDIATPLHLEGVREITELSHHHAMGIGGIHLQNAAEVVRAGADGIAVVSYLMQATDVKEAARCMKEAIEKECI